VSTNFIIFGPTDQKLWIFEVFRRSLGRRACDVANEVELTKVPKSGGSRRKKGGGRKEKWRGRKNKMGPTRGQRPAVTRGPRACPIA
jgi:hypothetical protein